MWNGKLVLYWVNNSLCRKVTVSIRQDSAIYNSLFSFSMTLHQFSISWICVFVVFGVTTHFILILITTYYTWDLPFEFWHKISILVAIYFANICIYSIACQFMFTQCYLFARFNNINDILSQLVFDEPVDNRKMKSKIAPLENGSVIPAEYQTQRRNAQNVFKTNGKLAIAVIDTDDRNITQMSYPFDKEFPRSITSNRGGKEYRFSPFSFAEAFKT